MRNVLFAVREDVRVAPELARQWFIELQAYPERYQFGTHAGFVFTSGIFGEVGARFRTRERFRGLPLTLAFELTEVGESSFRFRLVRPALPVWGAFVIEGTGVNTTSLSLVIGEDRHRGAWFLRLPVVRGAVQRQIRGELAHIRSSMEALSSSRGS
jgi:hypothetical protein